MIANFNFHVQTLLTFRAFKQFKFFMETRSPSFRKTFTAVQIFQQNFLLPSISHWSSRTADDVLLRQRSFSDAVFWPTSLVIQVTTSFFHPYFNLHLNSIRKSLNILISRIISRAQKNSLFYLHSALSSSGFTETMYPCVHLGQSNVLAWVDNSSPLLHRWQVHQKNFASFKCCRLFSVPCWKIKKMHAVTMWKTMLLQSYYLKGVSIAKSYRLAPFQWLRRANR